MDEDEIEYMDKILQNRKNDKILKSSFPTIEREKIEILKSLYLSKISRREILSKLKKYKYVDDFDEIELGNYFRWINLKNIKDLKLTNGGILCEIKICDDPILVFKNYMNNFFQINFNESLLFQKLTSQEEIILYAIKFINK